MMIIFRNDASAPLTISIILLLIHIMFLRKKTGQP